MKTILKYRTNDGCEFEDEATAQNHEALLGLVEIYMSPLGDVPQEVRDGKGWLQHDLEVVNQAKDDILSLCRERWPNESAFRHMGRDCHALSFVGRLLNDMGGPIDKAWSRFSRIDERGREHQQCYFAHTAGPSADHICIEGRTK